MKNELILWVAILLICSAVTVSVALPSIALWHILLPKSWSFADIPDWFNFACWIPGVVTFIVLMELDRRNTHSPEDE